MFFLHSFFRHTMDQSKKFSDISGLSGPLFTANMTVTQMPAEPLPPSTATVTKNVPNAWFSSEIQHMMHGFGDCSTPLAESAALIEQIVREQIMVALYKAEEIAKQRNARFIGIEDFLFLLRHDKIKLRRLVKYMELKDMKRHMLFKPVDEETDNSEGDIKPQPKKRKKICYDFLNNIDQTGELISVCKEENFVDEVKHERALRAEVMSQGMDAQKYLDFCTARQVSFVSRYKPQKFRDWLFQGITLEVKPNPLAMETLSYLAYEIVAQVMDLCLIVKHDMKCDDALTKVTPHVVRNYDVSQSQSNVYGASAGGALESPSSVPSSPCNSPPSISTIGTGFKSKISKKSQGGSVFKQLITNEAITQSHILEAMRRYKHLVGPFAEFHNYSKNVSKFKLLCT